MLDEHVLYRAVSGEPSLLLVNNKPSHNSNIGKKDNYKIEDAINHDAVAGVVGGVCVCDITAIHCVCPGVDTCHAKNIPRYGSKAPDPNEEDEKVNILVSKHWILMIVVLRWVPHKPTV